MGEEKPKKPKKSVSNKKKPKSQTFKPSKTKKPKFVSEMAFKYEAAWNKCYYDSPEYIKTIIKDEPNGRHAKALSHKAASLAESPNFKPKRAMYAGKKDMELSPQDMLTGFFGNN
jgi:hypothetical protein